MELYLRNDGREYHGNETYKRKKQKTLSDIAAEYNITTQYNDQDNQGHHSTTV